MAAGDPKPEADVVLSWFSSGAVAADAFERPTKFVQLPTPEGQKYDQMLADIASSMGMSNTPLRAVLKKYAPDIRPARIALLGFSEGCQGVRSVLRSKDARRVDSVIAIDGIHAQFQPSSHTALNPGYLTAWAAFARMAAQGERLMVDTTSSIVPPYPTVSTTDTAAWLWREATGSDEDRYDNQAPAGILPQNFNPPLVLAGGSKGMLVWPETTYEFAPVHKYKNKGQLWIINYNNFDPTGHNDHVLQAQKILPAVLRAFLATRWNLIAPSDGICVLSDGEDTTPPPVGCFGPTRLSDLYWSGDAEPDPLDINPNPDPSIPTPFEPGHGTPSEEAPPEGVSDTATKALKWLGGILASAAVIEIARRTGSYIARHPAVAPKA